MSECIRCLTVRQPFAWAITAGVKQFENRAWSTAYRGPVLIHAGASRDGVRTIAATQRRGRVARLQGHTVPLVECMAFGAIVGVARLTACLTLREARLLRLPFVKGPVCWHLEGARPFAEPIPVAGQLGLWDVPDGLVARVEEQLSAA